MREIRLSGSMSGMWKRSMIGILRHRQPKGSGTDRPHLNHRATSRLYLRIEGERIYLHAIEVPLQNILQGMAQQGIRVRIDPEVNPRVSASYEDRDIQEAIAEIVKPYNHVLVWEKVPDKSSAFRLSEIQIFRPGQKDIMQDLRSRTFSLAKGQKDGALFVRDELLLKVRSKIDFDKLLAKIGGTITDKNEARGIYKVSLPAGSDIEAIANSINSSPDIAQAAPDYAYPINSLYRTDRALPSSDNVNVIRRDNKVPVAVLDSGLIPGIASDGFVIASFDAVNPTNPISDNLGHGTQMALIASGQITPFGATKEDGGQVPVIAIRAMDDNGFTTDFTILKSIDYAMEKGARVISLSWGSANDSEFLKEILDDAAAKGMIIVASAGNEPTGKPVYPAAYSFVIGVGAAYPDGKVWNKSNYGSFVSLYAPGFAAFTVGYKGYPGIYVGTSISAAFVANGIANYLSKYPESSIQQIKAALMAGTLMAGK
jgi:thermitase